MTDTVTRYSDMARVLTARFGLDPPADRRQVHAWAARGTRNRDGQPFPLQARTASALMMSADEVCRWYAAGVPARGWFPQRGRQRWTPRRECEAAS